MCKRIINKKKKCDIKRISFEKVVMFQEANLKNK